MSQKCAVVGANGFLGKALTIKLEKEGYSVTAVYNKNSSNIVAGMDKISIRDFLNTENQHDYIILSLGNYLSTHSDLIEINDSIYKIMKNNQNAKIIFISSTNVYGIHERMIHVNSSYNSPALYPFSKLAGEFLVSSHKKHIILRMTYLYGKGLDNKSFLPNIIDKAKLTGQIVLFGDGSRKQDYLHIDDAVDLCIASLKSDGNGVFLGASGVSVSNYEIAQIISQKYNSEILLTGVETGSSFYFDIENTKTNLNWVPKVSIKQGVNEMLEL